MSPILTGVIASGISGNLTPPWSPEGAYDALATVTVGSLSVSSIIFSGIPTGYKHLQIRGIGSSTGTGGVEVPLIRFNNDSTSNYAAHRLYGDGSSAAADAFTSQTWMRAGFVNDSSNADIMGALVIDILDYTSTNKNKTMRVLSGVDRNGSGFVTLSSGLWFKTPEAINRIDLIVNGLNWTSDTTFALFGVK